jgi:hypothetical protein
MLAACVSTIQNLDSVVTKLENKVQILQSGFNFLKLSVEEIASAFQEFKSATDIQQLTNGGDPAKVNKTKEDVDNYFRMDFPSQFDVMMEASELRFAV